MWWLVGYVVGCIAMGAYVVWSCIDYPLPRTWTSIVHIVLGVVFWPVTTAIIICGIICALANELMFEQTTKSRHATAKTARRAMVAACDQRNSKQARWCRRCGRPLSGGRHAGDR
jgi:hypothetical protein